VTGDGMTAVPSGSAVTAPRVLLLVPARTYRAADFLLAAARMGLDLVVGSDGALPLGTRPVIPVSPGDPDGSASRILARSGPVAAVVAADTPMLVLAAAVAARMGLPHNPVDAVLNATDKARQRRRWAVVGVAQPQFAIVPAAAPQDAIRQAAEAVGFPCVVKAVSLSASQGILRADDTAAAQTAARRIRQVLAAARRPASEPLLVEEYLPGPELSIDGLLAGGDLTVTAIFDKPATPDGPTFEETMLVTPSRLPRPVLAAAIRTAGQAARALGLTAGPVHAELRIGGSGGQARPVMLELAARSIGGLCSRALRLPGGKTLEELVLANALGQPAPALGDDPTRPSGVFMLPVPRPGVLHAVEGRDNAAAVPGITGLTITIPVGQRVLPLPDGDRYLGFIFAEAGTWHDVENALTAACGQLRVVIQ
jgi:biotin carboxylase